MSSLFSRSWKVVIFADRQWCQYISWFEFQDRLCRLQPKVQL